MSDIFISYSRDETKHAETIAQALQSRGLSVWWDRQIIAGEQWAESISKELDRARIVLVLWSSASVNSMWVVEEAAYARESSKLVQVILENITQPIGFTSFQAADLSGWNGNPNEKAFLELVDHLEKILSS